MKIRCFGSFILFACQSRTFLIIFLFTVSFFYICSYVFFVFCFLLFSCVTTDLDFAEKRCFSPDREQREVCSSVSDCVCVLALRHQLMNLMNMNITQGSDGASSFSLNSHTYSQKGYLHSIRPQQDPSIKPRQHHPEENA